MKTESVGKKIKKLRENKGIEAQKLAQFLQVGKSTLSNWESDRRKPDSETLVKIANYFNVSVDYLLSNTDNKTDVSSMSNVFKFDISNTVKIPVIGEIKAGVPMLAEDNIIDYEYVHQEELIVGEEYFYLQIKGDSMINARISEGDRVLIKKQNYIENDGDIMAVRVNGDEATLKRVFKQRDGLILKSENPNYAPMFYPASDIETGYVGIIGRAIEVKIKF